MYLRIFLVVLALVVVAAFPVAAADAHKGFTQLFNGKNLEGFDIVLKEKGVNHDPDGVFRIEKGAIHVSGAEYGYVITKKEYENYHLRAEFKWGEETYPPRKDKAR